MSGRDVEHARRVRRAGSAQAWLVPTVRTIAGRSGGPSGFRFDFILMQGRSGDPLLVDPGMLEVLASTTEEAREWSITRDEIVGMDLLGTTGGVVRMTRR